MRTYDPPSWDNQDELLRYNFSTGVYELTNRVLGTESAMPSSVRKIYDQLFSKITIDVRMHKRIQHYVSTIFSRDTNVEWFGSALLGVHTIRFYDTDRDRFFDEVIQVDEDYLTELLNDKKLSDMVMEWNVTGDVFNLTVVYLVHRYLPLIDKDKLAYDAIVSLVELLQFKFYTSIYSHFFKRPVDLPAAEATYAALSMKFDIKQVGSWGKHIRARAEYFVSKESPHYDNIKRFQDTPKIIYFISDLNTRTKQTVKDYYAILDVVRRDNSRMLVQSAMVDVNGETILRDRVSAFNTAKQNLLEASMSLSSMYKEELARVVLEIVPKASPNALKTIIVYITSLPYGKERGEIEQIMVDTLTHAFDYVTTNRVNFTDVAFLLNKLRALYMASKTTDPYILTLRTRIEKLAKKHTHLRRDADLAALRNALLLYFMIRALASVNN